MVARRSLHRLLLALGLIYLHCSSSLLPSVEAQFLFTYEINQEDDSRTPKSTLFDPNSFKIVTPSQLQSSYAKISSQLSSLASSHSPSQHQTLTPDTGGHHQQSPTSLTSITASVPHPHAHSHPLPLPHVQHQRAASAASQQPPHQPATTGSFLKQTSAALQSFAELFNFSPAPAAQPQIPLPQGSPHAQIIPRQPQQQVSNTQLTDEQAENVRSLGEHWAQQQQQQQRHRSPEVASTFASVNSVEENGPGPALSSFTTATSHPNPSSVTRDTGAGHQRSQAGGSYWLTGNGQANTQDGSFLFEIKPPGSSFMDAQNNNEDEQTSTVSFPHNLLSLTNSQPQQPASLPKSSFPLRPAQQQQQPQANMAQASFLSTPTTYYPGPASETMAPTGVPPMMRHQQQQHQQQQHHHRPQMQSQHSTSMHHQQQFSHQPKLESASQFHMNISQIQPMRSLRAIRPQPMIATLSEDSMSHQLSPPANLPEHFVDSSLRGEGSLMLNSGPLRSAEESLNAYRALQSRPASNFAMDINQRQSRPHQPELSSHRQQQQQQQHQHQKPIKEPALLPPATPASTFIFPLDNGIEQPEKPQATQQHQQQPPQTTPHHPEPTVKISPQIYESFLLQQRDQHEKHMELLKQQQELNRLIEQQEKQKQAESEKEAARKRRKKEELEKEAARKRARQDYELAQQQQQKKLKLELEERKRRELEEKRRRDEEERKRRDEDERRRRELEERKRRELEEEERKRRAEAEELERKQLEERRYREFLEARERELTRREEEEKRAREAADRKRREEEEAAEARSKFLRQKEELRRLLELKAREEQELEMRRKQSVVSRASQVERANKLGQELRDRVALSAWVAPMRLRSTTTTSTTPATSTSAQYSTTSGSVSSTSTEGPANVVSTSTSGSPSSEKPPPATGRRILARVAKKQRVVSAGNEKLIRQKIPLYSGPGQYGLYRGTNSTLDSDLAALLDSVTLPVSKSTTTTTTTTASPILSSSRSPVSESFSTARSSSLSPLLTDPNSIAFDDDVPRRPVRNLSSSRSSSSSSSLGFLQQSASNRQQSAAAATSSFMLQRTNFNESTTTTTAPISSTSTTTTTTTQANHNQRHAHIGLASLPADADNDGIPGRAGVEYPVLSEVPSTSFSCAKQPLNGYYADTETACQVVHLCQGGVQSSILCPNGTIFNQEKFSCQWWYEVNCSRAPMFYQLNDNLYKGPRLANGERDPAGTSSAPKKRRQIVVAASKQVL